MPVAIPVSLKYGIKVYEFGPKGGGSQYPVHFPLYESLHRSCVRVYYMYIHVHVCVFGMYMYMYFVPDT